MTRLGRVGIGGRRRESVGEDGNGRGSMRALTHHKARRFTAHTVFKTNCRRFMADPMVELWKGTAQMFKWHVLGYLENVGIEEADREKLEIIPRVMDDFFKIRTPTTLYTRDNLVLLVKCWRDFCAWTDGVRYWNKEFPEWAFMIAQFQIFVNEFEMKEMMKTGNSSIDDLGTKITTTTSSIEDIQGRVKKLEQPWWSRRGKYKDGSGSGERMVVLLRDLEKLSCSEKREED